MSRILSSLQTFEQKTVRDICFYLLILAMRIKSKIIITYSLIFLLSLFFVSFSVFIPQEVHNKKELSEIEFGLPLKFLKQDQSLRDPPFPWKFNMENPAEVIATEFSWIEFSFSVIIVFVVFSLVSKFFVKLFKLKL